MRLLDVASLSFENMKGRKLRAWLTVLGIVIAVASIVVLISLANGVNASVSSRLTGLGNDIITVTAGSNRAIRSGGGFPGFGGGFAREGPGGGGFGGVNTPAQLTFKDAQELQHVEGVWFVDARLTGRLRAEVKSRNATVQVIGVDPNAFRAMNTVDLLSGRLLNTNDQYSIVLGNSIYNNTFGNEPLLNRQIRIDNYSFRVVGLLNRSSGSQITSDNAVYLPISVAKYVLNETENPNQIYIKIRAGLDPDVVAASLDAEMLLLHHKTPDTADFTITTASFVQSAISGVMDTLTLFLGGIAAISLLVGAIGVANTMFMSVLERTKEIGILKAMGMKDGEITAMFLIEAAIIGSIGGVLGVALSFLVSAILGYFSVPTVISADLVLGALLFSSMVGVFAGVVPARNAARMQPVDALRYE